jgi:transposase
VSDQSVHPDSGAVKPTAEPCRQHMICPVEIASDMSAFLAGRVGDHAKHGILLEGRSGASDESARRDVAGHAKKITWWQAAEILGISDRHMRRWRERYEREGYNGLMDRRRGKPSRRRVALATVEKVLALYREKYFDMNVQHFHEKLEAEHDIELSYTWVKQALQGAGLVARGRKRGVHRKRRPRRPLPGMLLHIDGSRHQWLQDERWYDLIVILDDATSEIYYAQLVEEESTVTVMAGLKEVIERKGVFCALYSDRGSHFWLTPKVGARWTTSVEPRWDGRCRSWECR